jgi:hypothetical protein
MSLHQTILQSEPTFESFVFLFLICGANLLNRPCGWGFFSFSSALLFCFIQVVRFSFYSSMHIFNVFKFKIVHLTTSTSKSMLQVSNFKRSRSRFEVATFSLDFYIIMIIFFVYRILLLLLSRYC